jgi:hypothetical protein
MPGIQLVYASTLFHQDLIPIIIINCTFRKNIFEDKI